MAEEIVGLFTKKAFKLIVRREIGEGVNVLGGRFVLEIKNKGSDKEIFKARYVMQGHMDKKRTG